MPPRHQLINIATPGVGFAWFELYPICQKGIGESVIAAVERAANMEHCL